MGLKTASAVDVPVQQDVSEHLAEEVFEKTIDQVKNLSEDSCMRKVNA